MTSAIKYILIHSLIILLFGCSEESSTDSNELIGRWLSNCYEDIGDFGISNGFAIEEYEFTEDGAYVSSIAKFTDFDCITPDGNTLFFDATYTLGDILISTDGNTVQLITVIQTIFSTSTFVFDLAFRITGDELNFDFLPGPVPNIVYTITFVKQ